MDHVVGRLGPVHPGLAGQDVRLLERAFGRTRFLYLRRDDVLAQAVSWSRAEQTGAWYAAASGEIGGAEPSGREPGYDAAEIGALIGRIDEHNAARSWPATGARSWPGCPVCPRVRCGAR
ncbi:Stf0 family sulfotransferase [Nonomuraea angiospora]